MHHPIAVEKYYDEQKVEALERATSYRADRLTKFLKYFENVLSTNPDAKSNKGTYLLGSTTTMADLTLFHVSTELLSVLGGN